MHPVISVGEWKYAVPEVPGQFTLKVVKHLNFMTEVWPGRKSREKALLYIKVGEIFKEI